MVRVQYSYGGLDYIETDGKLWDDPGDLAADSGDITLFCYGLDEYPLAAFQSQGVNSLYLKMLYDVEGTFDSVELEPIRLSHENTYAIPEAPPFSADFKMEGGSYTVIGHFRDFAPNVARVRTAYSWDGITYQYSDPEWPRHWLLKDLGNEDSAAQQRLEHQEIASRYEEPLESFVSRQQDSFYLRLEITTEDNEMYFSQPAYISRGEPQPLPEHLTPRVSLGFDLAVSESRNDNGNAEDDENYYPELVTYTHGQYQLSVGEDATPSEIMALLPDTVPVRVRFWDKETREKYAFGDLNCPIVWKAPPDFTLTPGEPLVLTDMAEPLFIPAGTDVVTALGTFTLQKPLTFQSLYDSDALDLVLTPMAAGEAPKVALRAYNLDLVDENGENQNETRIDDPLTLAFWNKPSGATSIQAEVVVDGVRMELFDLLERRDIHHNQSHALYGYVDLLQPEEYPYQDYLSGALAGFSIALTIQGGVYDDKQVTLPWPMVYDAPEEIFDPYDIDGNENNAGSNFEEIDEDAENGGQRPDLPQEPESPPTIPPLPMAVGTHPMRQALHPRKRHPPSRPRSLRHRPPPCRSQPRNRPRQAVLWRNYLSTPPAARPPPCLRPLPEPSHTQTAEPTSPIPSDDEKGADTKQQPDCETEVRNPALPMAATAAVVLVGGGIAVGVGTASGKATVSGFARKLMRSLRKLFHKR